MFLKLTTERGGWIKGEAQDSFGLNGKLPHTDEIEILGWSWGMQSPTDASSGQSTGRRQYRTVRMYKNLDASSPAIMAALSNNDLVKDATLVVRKLGGVVQIEFFKMKLTKGRIVKFDIEYPDETMLGREVIEFAFQKIEISYLPQGKDGAKRGAIDFMDEWAKGND